MVLRAKIVYLRLLINHDDGHDGLILKLRDQRI